MSTKRTSLFIALALSLVLTLSYGCTAPSGREAQLKNTTLQIKQAVQSEMNSLDLDISAAASQLSTTGLSGTEARQILNRLVGKYPFIIDCAIGDDAGNMVTVAPEAYSSYEGSYIGTQNVTQPILDNMFTAVEGMDAVALIWPIFSDKGDFMGTLSALFKPEALLAPIVEPIIKDTGIAVDVMQLDGLNLYDSQGTDTGLNLFTDPAFQPYTDLIALGNRMVAEESGSGSYTIISHSTGKTIKKDAFWASVSLHGTAWRVMSALVIE